MDESPNAPRSPLWRAPRQHLAWAAALVASTSAIANANRAPLSIGAAAGLLAAFLWLRHRQSQSPPFPPLAAFPSPKELGGMLAFALPIWFAFWSYGVQFVP